MISNFRAISLSHKNVPVAVREIMSLDEASCKRLMISLKEFTDAAEILVLSTCNRTEVYYASSCDCSLDIIKLIGIQKGILSIEDYISHFNVLGSQEQAVSHLFEVSMGLDSHVIGDMQIGNQVKNAYQWSVDLDMAGPFLHRLMHTIFFTNKKAVQTTAFRDGAASVSYATVELAESLCTDLMDPKVLIIGLGEMGEDVCRNMIKSSLKNITITNRTFIKAKELAKNCDVNAIPFEDVWEAIQEADVIIGSLSREEALITKTKVEALNLVSYKYFIDISVPRSVEAEVEEVPGALVYNIDHIQSKTTLALERRMQAIPQVKKIIEESIEEFNDWTKETLVSPVINKLKNALEQIRQKEMGRHLKNLSESESEKIEMITKSMMQKIIKLPVLQLKAACKRGEPETLIEVLNELFDLEQQPVEDR